MITFPCTKHPHGRILAQAPPCRLSCGSEFIERTCACCGSRALGLTCRWWEHGNPPADVDEGEPGSARAGLVLCWECACESGCLRAIEQRAVQGVLFS